jgi:hypothetical protein
MSKNIRTECLVQVGGCDSIVVYWTSAAVCAHMHATFTLGVVTFAHSDSA